MEYIAEIRNVSKRFGDETVVREVTMSLEAGKIYGVAGRNGSGKTVLFKMIIGFLRPSSGKIFVHGKEIGKDVDFAEDIGIIIETPGFLGSFNGYKNLEYLACIKKQIGKEEIRQSMKLVGLDPDSKKKVKKYSFGMRQRLGIAQAILDEPMNGLDREGAANIRALFLKLKEEGVTILLASHHREDIEELCDEVYEMEDGRLRRISVFNLSEEGDLSK